MVDTYLRNGVVGIGRLIVELCWQIVLAGLQVEWLEYVRLSTHPTVQEIRLHQWQHGQS